MLSLQALGLLVFSLNRSVVLATLAGFFIFLTNSIGHGEVYGIALLGTPHNYGVIGLSYAVLTIGLAATGCWRAAAFCLGLFPYVHPSWGVFLFAVVFLGLLWEGRPALDILRKNLLYFVAGLVITFAGYGIQGFWLRDLPRGLPEITHAYMSTFVQYWDHHRVPFFHNLPGAGIHLFKKGALFCVFSAGLSFLGLRYLHQSREQKLLLRFLLVSAVASLGLATLTHLPPKLLPDILSMLMPGRWTNLSNITFFALAVGLLSGRAAGRGRATFGLFILLLLLPVLSTAAPDAIFKDQRWLKYFWWIRHAARACFYWPILLGMAVVALFHKRLAERVPGLFLPVKPGFFSVALFLLLIVMLPFKMDGRLFNENGLWPPKCFMARISSGLPSVISRRSGLLLTTSDFYYIQLETRRPVLITPCNMTEFFAVPESGPLWNNCLKKIYGVDMLVAPPESSRHLIGIPNTWYRNSWERRSRAEWAALAGEFGFVDVLTPADWRLNLEMVHQGDSVALFTIAPESSRPPKNDAGQ